MLCYKKTVILNEVKDHNRKILRSAQNDRNVFIGKRAFPLPVFVARLLRKDDKFPRSLCFIWRHYTMCAVAGVLMARGCA